MNSAGYSIICFSFRVKECPVPTNKELADDDPELLDLMEGGGLQAGTIREGGIFRSEMLRKKGGHRK